MNRIKNRTPVPITTGSTTSSSVTFNSGAWFVLEVPDADKAKAVTIQALSAISADTWLDVVTLADVTNRMKTLTPAELAAVGCLDQIRLKFASAPAANGNAFLHWSS